MLLRGFEIENAATHEEKSHRKVAFQYVLEVGLLRALPCLKFGQRKTLKAPLTIERIVDIITSSSQSNAIRSPQSDCVNAD